MKYIILSILLATSFSVSAQSVRPKAPNAPSTRSKSSGSTLDKMKRIFDQAINPYGLRVKGKGGQDGGGGDIEELELHSTLNRLVVQMKLYYPVLVNMRLLTAEESQELRRIFFTPDFGASQICLVVSDKQGIELCSNEPYKIAIPSRDWKSMSVTQQQNFAMKEVLKIIGVQGETRLSEKADQILNAIDPKREEKMNRYDIIDQSRFEMQAVRNQKNETRDALSWNSVRANGRDIFVLNIVSDGKVRSYALDPESPYLQVTPCVEENNYEEYAEILDQSYSLAEFKPMVKKCFDMVKAGKKIETIFTVDGKDLVLNCR